MSGRTFVVGDIHGCASEVAVLLDAIAPGAADTLVFLGDYIDRGPASKDVIDRLLRLRREGPQCVFLKGNHEDMFLDFIGLRGRYGEAFLFNGGGATLESYGLESYVGADVAERLPPDHRDFFAGLQLHHVSGAFLCVHAGIDPVRDLSQQPEEALLWIREEFICNRHTLGLTVLFGHTPQREAFLDLPYKLGLDTGLVYGNKLSCFETGDKELIQVGRGLRTVTRRSLAGEFAAAEVSVVEWERRRRPT